MNITPRQFFVPEVVQTSAMDCGPAALKSILEGFGIPVSYGRLRDACQTDLDGTSIDTLEEVANSLGLDARQVMLPPDHIHLPEAAALPALAVVSLASGLTHFVVIWRRHGSRLQVMDPATGRRWTTLEQLRRELFIHRMEVPAAAWYEWARTEEFLAPLRRQLRDLGAPQAALKSVLEWPREAAEGADWRPLAALDAATRLAASLVQRRAIGPGAEAAGLLEGLWRQAVATPEAAREIVPEAYWSVLPAAAEGETGEECLQLIGAVLVKAVGLHAATDAATTAPHLAADLAAVIHEPPPRPLREMWRLLRGDGAAAWAALGSALALAALGTILEALLLRGMLELGQELNPAPQRIAAAGALLLLMAALLWLEIGATRALLRLGRRLEVRLRLAVLERLPLLPDHYFRSRPVSDMAERAHAVDAMNRLPQLAGQWLKGVMTLLATTAAIVWLYPGSAPIVAVAALAGIGLPLLFTPALQELDLRARTHNGALTQFYLDALLGLTAIRAHGAEAAVRREQEGRMLEWGAASLRLFEIQWLADAIQATVGAGLSIWLLFDYAAGGGDPAGVLLLAYWGLGIPALGEEIAHLTRQFPAYRNLGLRLLEPLQTPLEQEAAPPFTPCPAPAAAGGVDVRLAGVTVQAGGHVVLDEIDLHLPPGAQVAVVGASGAGKSSLAGLLLGWHRPSAGEVRVDGEPLDSGRLERLRRELVWIDPAVRLWNRTLLDNLNYGAQGATGLSGALADAELPGVIERLPDGLQTALGEGGGRLSGGEGQRVRVGRGLLRCAPRLVVLDEPFRGLERPLRHALLERTRARWAGATLLCITHDVPETLAFDRVLVVEQGRVVEDGDPRQLSRDPHSRYRALLDVEQQVHDAVWGAPGWRRVRIEEGRIRETPAPADRAAGR